MAEYNFNDDIIVGEEGEQVVLNDLIKKGGEFIKFNKDNKFDLLLSVKVPKKVKYEIKTDVFCKPNNDTGNMFIEFECRGKQSGIEVTEADWFVMYYKYLNEIWYIKTEELKKLLYYNDFKITSFSGDEGSNTKGYLIPRNKYKKHFTISKVK